MRLSNDHFKRALRDSLLTGEEFEVDQDEVEAVNAALALSGHDDGDPDRVAVVVSVASALARAGLPGPGRFSTALTRAALADLGYDFADHGRALASFLDAVKLDTLRSDATLDRVRRIIARTLRCEHPGHSRNGDVELPLRVFVAEPITATGGTAPGMQEARECVTTLLSEFGIACHCAMHYADPAAFGRATADDPTWHARDEREIASSDLVLILHPYPSSGLGVVGELARRHGVPVVVADKSGQLSPMLIGGDERTRRIPLGPETALELLTVILHDGPLLDSFHARRERSEMRQWNRERTQMLHTIEELRDQGISTFTPLRLTRVRLHGLLSSDILWGSATRAEMTELERLVAGPVLPPLQRIERAALEQAARNNRWTDEQMWRVEVEGRGVLQSDESSAVLSYRKPSRAHSTRFWEAVAGDVL